jgi:nickel transport protein
VVFFFLFAVLGLGFCVFPAWAHKVTIFAWVEGDTVYTQSKFSGGKKAKNSTVVVYDKEGNQLLEGKTNDKGEFSFKVPKKTTLKVALKASMGHLAEWTIPEEEITEVADSPINRTTGANVEVSTQQAPSLTEEKAAGDHSVAPVVGLSRAEIQALIDGSLDRKLAPILTMLSEAVDSGPKMSEVIGGIGYIFGLVGVGLYFTARNKRK